MNWFHYRICGPAVLGVAMALFSSSAVSSVTSSLGHAGDYSIVVFGDFSSPQYSSTTGRVAVKGNILLDNYGLATGLAPEEAGISVIAGGNMSFQHGKIYAGHTLVYGSATQVSSTVRNGLTASQLLLDEVDLPMDFDALESQLLDRSAVLSQLPANGTVDNQHGGLYLSGDCLSDLQVFELDGAELLNAHTFQVSCIPENASIIFNVSGRAAGLRYLSLESIRVHREKVLFNFYQAQHLTFTYIGIHGSVLAPQAVVDNPTGDLHGTIVAKSWNGPMHLNFVRYLGYNEGHTSCEGPLQNP